MWIVQKDPNAQCSTQDIFQPHGTAFDSLKPSCLAQGDLTPWGEVPGCYDRCA